MTPGPISDTNALFPVRLNWKERRHWPDCPRTLAWGLVAPFEVQAQSNHYHSLQTLADCGGLPPVELWAVMNGKSWRGHSDPCRVSEAVAFLKALPEKR